MNEENSRNTKQMLNQVNLTIENNISEINNILHFMCSDEAILRYLKSSNSSELERITLETEAREKLYLYRERRTDLVSGMLVARIDGEYLSNNLFKIARNPLQHDDWFKKAIAGNGEPVLISKPIGRNLESYKVFSPLDIVSFAQAVKDKESREIIGVILIDIKLTLFENQLENLKIGQNGYLYVQNQQEEIVYCPSDNYSALRINPSFIRSLVNNETGSYRIDNIDYNITKIENKKLGITIIGVFPITELLPRTKLLIRTSTVIGIISIAVASILVFLYSLSFTTPISDLKILMAEAAKGDLDVRFNTKNYSGEIVQLGNSFNSMMDQLQELVAMVYAEQREKRKSEIRTLQDQIKPHFLYNTLDNIRWMAEQYDADDISEMVTALTKLFRISLSKGKDRIRLDKEIEHVRAYLVIQKERYEEKLNYSIDIAPQFHDLEVPKLILQPLVENAIYHGIKESRNNGHIDITCESDGEDIIILVKDDGVGISQEKCDKMNASLNDLTKEEEIKGYGIYNVNKRIKYTYGSKYGLVYKRNNDGGTIVVVRLSRKINEDDLLSVQERIEDQKGVGNV